MMVQPWMAQVSTALVSASGYNDKAEVDWWAEVLEKTFDELFDSADKLGRRKRYIQLDANLSVALIKQAPKDVKRRHQQEVSKAWKMSPRKIVTGRQVGWLILEAWKTTSTIAPVYVYKNLYEFPRMGDNMVPEFTQHWLNYVDGQKTR